MHTHHISKPKAVALAFIAGWIAVQFVPVDRSNPPVTGEVEAPSEVAAVLRRACYDCHSNEARWPWYGYLAPVSWVMAHGVAAGRAAVNYSTWPDYDATEAAARIQASIAAAVQGRMPPRHHATLRPDARLSPEDLAVLKAWAEAGE